MNDFKAESVALSGKMKALAAFFADNLKVAKDNGELGSVLGDDARRILADYVGPQARALLEMQKRLDASLKANSLPPFDCDHLQDVQDASKQ